MAAALAIASFLCAILLAVFIPVKRVRTSIPNLAIVLWLCGCNLAHGVNAVVWSSNVVLRTPIWCDIATKFVLGTNVALPGALICVARHLELLSSSRKLSLDPKVKRNHILFEIVCCYVIPLVYMSLHIVAQDHRYDLVQDFGCLAAIHPSTPALVVVWTPPLLLCAVSFFFCGLTTHNTFRFPIARFKIHLDARSPTHSSLFFRRLTMSMIMTSITAITALFSFFSIPVIRPWDSWASVHVSLGKVDIINQRDEVSNIRLRWWCFFSISVTYILLSFAIGEECRDSYKWLRKLYHRRREIPRPLLSLWKPKQEQLPQSVSRSQSLTIPQERPRTIELRSGWDDMLDLKVPKSSRSLKRSKSNATSPPSSRSPSAASMTATTMTAEDEAFMASTLSYLGSPTAQTLGISPSIATPLPVLAVQRRPVPSLSLTIGDSALQERPIIYSSARSLVAAKPVSAVSSVLEATWPVPPKSASPIGSTSSRYSSRSHSSHSSAEETLGNPLYPTITPPHRHIRPFEGSSISSSIHSTPLPSTTPVRSPSLKQSFHSLRQSWSRDRIRHTSSEVIHMTVVKETV